MSRRKPLPFSPIPFDRDDDEIKNEPRGKELWKSAPLNEIDALMRAAPHSEPERSQTEWLATRELLCDAMDDCLTEQERFIVNATVIERKALRAIAQELGMTKSTVHNVQHESLRKLRVHLTPTEGKSDERTRHDCIRQSDESRAA